MYFEIRDMIDSLDVMPGRFALYDEKKNIRKLSVRKYNVYYSIDSSSNIVRIYRVLYGGVDIRKVAME